MPLINLPNPSRKGHLLVYGIAAPASAGRYASHFRIDSSPEGLQRCEAILGESECIAIPTSATAEAAEQAALVYGLTVADVFA